MQELFLLKNILVLLNEPGGLYVHIVCVVYSCTLPVFGCHMRSVLVLEYLHNVCNEYAIRHMDMELVVLKKGSGVVGMVGNGVQFKGLGCTLK